MTPALCAQQAPVPPPSSHSIIAERHRHDGALDVSAGISILSCSFPLPPPFFASCHA
jgi:hypothetical protein